MITASGPNFCKMSKTTTGHILLKLIPSKNMHQIQLFSAWRLTTITKSNTASNSSLGLPPTIPCTFVIDTCTNCFLDESIGYKVSENAQDVTHDSLKLKMISS